jgi:hypothetical protein
MHQYGVYLNGFGACKCVVGALLRMILRCFGGPALGTKTASTACHPAGSKQSRAEFTRTEESSPKLTVTGKEADYFDSFGPTPSKKTKS